MWLRPLNHSIAEIASPSYVRNDKQYGGVVLSFALIVSILSLLVLLVIQVLDLLGYLQIAT
ncbi:MAG: hypothetical protein HY584_01825 [Candidatus Omnitrophica bacterium]|nr:hypothetical protein [Candidatus Omnitrophota bacterium]